MPRLCIVGGGSTRLAAPFDDKDAIIWSTFSVGQELPRVDACFEIHTGVYSPEQLNRIPCVKYIKAPNADIKNSVVFPIGLLISEFGRRFNGTMAMILGYAILEGHTDIWLYGVDMATDAEYSRRNFFYWLMGYATAKGVSITIPGGSFLYDTCATYSYEPSGVEYIDFIRQKLEVQTKNDEAALAMMHERHGYAQGVKETLEQIERRH